MANIVDKMTERLLADAGIRDAMRVLDVGCGRGDVSLMAARLIGRSGQVVGIDKDPAPLAAARGRMSELNLLNVSFHESDLEAFISASNGFGTR